MGTPDFAVPSLVALVEAPDVEVVLVVSQPDRRSGRGKKVRPTPIRAAADRLGVPTYQPETLRNPEAIERLREAEADLFVVAAYGQILRKVVLGLPRLGCVNVHGSLLPRWRGAAPIHRAVAAGDAVTGVSIMQMERGLDTGPVYRMGAVMIGDAETTGELHDRLANLGADLLIESLPDIADPSFTPTAQPSARTTYASMLGADDREIDFDRAAVDVASHINGMSPWPGARVRINDEILTVLRARTSEKVDAGRSPGQVVAASPRDGLHIRCAHGVVEILELKRAGKRAVNASQCLNGLEIPIGTTCGPTR